MALRTFTSAVVLALALAPAAALGQGAAKSPASTAVREANLQAYVALLRSDLRANKSALMAEVMQLTEEEDKKFWPIYREYEAALAKINDERFRLVMGYADTFGEVTDEAADKIAKSALELEGRRHVLLSTHYDRMKKALSAKTAARALQVEHQFLLLLDLQIASALPVPQ